MNAALLLALTAAAQIGPGLGNIAYDPAEVFTPVGYIQSPEGHGNAAMVQGYLMVIYSSDGGGSPNDGGIEFWDVSNPRAPRLAVSYDNADTHGLREAHGFSLAWHGNQLLLAAQGIVGIQIWDVTDPHAIRLLSYLPIPGIAVGDYSGDWWTFWQAPYLYVAGVDRGLTVVDTTIPTAPFVASQIATGALGGVSPSQVFVLGNMAVIMESQGGSMATLDVSSPTEPRVLRQYSGGSGYSHLFAGDGKILTSGNIPPRAHIAQVGADGEITALATIGFFLDSGGYGSYQDGIFHTGFSKRYVKFQIDPPMDLGDGSSGREGRDEDFATVLGNLVFAGDDHGVGTALVAHQAAPDTTAPTVMWMSPAAGTAGVALTSRVGLSFSDHIDASSLTAATIWLEDSTGAVVSTVRSSQLGLVNLAPEAELGLLETYKIVAVGVRDVAGNASPRFEGTFTTGDGSVPLSPTAAITNVDLNIGFGRYALGTFAEGKKPYSDRSDTFTAQFPPRFDHQPYLVTAHVDRNNFLSDFLSFELLAPAEVMILYDARATSIPNWMGGYMATGETVVASGGTFDVYSQRFPVGSVRLGGNGANGARGQGAMYSVVIIPDPIPCAIDLSPALTGTVTLTAMGPANGTYDWRIGTRRFTIASPRVSLPPGRHAISLTVTSGVLGRSCGGVKIVHRPLVAQPARVAGKLAWVGGHTVSVNADHGTVSRIDPASSMVVWEKPVGGRPETLAIDGDELWVVDGAGAKIVVLAISTGDVRRSIALPRASQPFGLVFDPSGTAFVTLAASGEVVRLAPDGTIADRASVPSARGLTWFADQLYVTRFISPDDRGEVRVLDAATLDPRSVLVLPFDPGPDTEATGRGVPNYVSETQIAPDGVTGFVSSKKDNIARGLFRDGQRLSFESRVRAIVSPFLVATASAAVHTRLDLNDREGVLTTLISPHADLIFMASQGVSTIDVFDVYTQKRVSSIEVGLAPRGMAFDATNTKLAVLNTLSRTVSYYDVGGLLGGTSNAAPVIATVSAVSREVLDPMVLAGKKIFHNAGDLRMSRDKYIACSSCHLDGDSDGRVWDFTQAGEGLRNTIPLAGRGGLAHGRVHWTANFDEIQDFEHDIRDAFGGKGFLSDADFALTRDPLGVTKAGRSPELDALAAYVSSLDVVPSSPHRAADGTLTVAARRGREVFVASNCARCHAGASFQDGVRYDVGTIKPSSGQGIGAALAGVGFDTPTLLGVWSSPPYFHDGSAATLEDVIARHGQIPAIADPDDLVRYLLELDGTSLPPEAPCGVECVGAAPPAPDASVTDDAAILSDAMAAIDASSSAADAGTPFPDAAAAMQPEAASGCGCQSTSGASGRNALELVLFAGLALVLRRRY